MSAVRLQHFICQGAGEDAPEEGYEVLESDVPAIEKGQFFTDIPELPDFTQVRVEEELDFDPFTLDDHPF